MMKQGDESSPCTTERDHEYIYIYIMLCELQKSAPSVFAHYGHPYEAARLRSQGTAQILLRHREFRAESFELRAKIRELWVFFRDGEETEEVG